MFQTTESFNASVRLHINIRRWHRTTAPTRPTDPLSHQEMTCTAFGHRCFVFCYTQHDQPPVSVAVDSQ